MVIQIKYKTVSEDIKKKRPMSFENMLLAELDIAMNKT